MTNATTVGLFSMHSIFSPGKTRGIYSSLFYVLGCTSSKIKGDKISAEEFIQKPNQKPNHRPKKKNQRKATNENLNKKTNKITNKNPIKSSDKKNLNATHQKLIRNQPKPNKTN